MPESVGFSESVLVSAAEMREIEAAAIARGVSEEALMDEAGAGLARAVQWFLPKPGVAVIFAGKGHNAGDAFVLARLLKAAGWTVETRLAFPEAELRPLARRKLEAAREATTFAPLEADDVPPGRPLLLVDGLLGTGARAESLRDPLLAACRKINALRDREHAVTLAVDTPSGLGSPDSVSADLTVTLGFPKDTLFEENAAACVGRLVHVPLKDLTPPEAARDFAVTPALLRRWLPGRPSFDKHKGQAGRVGIVAGSRGLTGAARLAATAASLIGGGLVTLFCPRDVYDVLAASCPPEVMVRPVSSCLEVMEFPLDALGVGPGLGPAPLPYLAELLLNDPRPAVLDADALNALAAIGLLSGGSWRPAGPRLLTPHPGELARLKAAWRPDMKDRSRLELARAFVAEFPVTLLAKSARSFVIEAGKPAAFNTAGHPLMARGGMGDVLTGFLATFLAQKMDPWRAAALGSWLTGFGAERLRWREGVEEPGVASRVMELAAGEGMAALREGEAL